MELVSLNPNVPNTLWGIKAKIKHFFKPFEGIFEYKAYEGYYWSHPHIIDESLQRESPTSIRRKGQDPVATRAPRIFFQQPK